VGHECVLAVIECERDRAVTQLLSGGQIENSELVPFDNNIAQRNLVPVDRRHTWPVTVRNPLRTRQRIELYMESTPERLWQVQSRLPNQVLPGLGGLETETAEFDVTPPARALAEMPPRLRIVALAAGRPIGGMTFYVPPATG
jgi:hypothetical protein